MEPNESATRRHDVKILTDIVFCVSPVGVVSTGWSAKTHFISKDISEEEEGQDKSHRHCEERNVVK